MPNGRSSTLQNPHSLALPAEQLPAEFPKGRVQLRDQCGEPWGFALGTTLLDHVRSANAACKRPAATNAAVVLYPDPTPFSGSTVLLACCLDSSQSAAFCAARQQAMIFRVAAAMWTTPCGF